MTRLLVAALVLSSLAAYGAVHQLAQLTPKNVPGVRVAFPSSIAISADGNTIVVGDVGARVNSNNEQGAVYVFVKPAGGWRGMKQTATLTASDGYIESFLGGSVSISGNTIVAGAAAGAHSDAGKAYVFVEPEDGWTDMTQSAELTPSDGADKDYFGASVSISGNTIVAGAPGIDDYQGATYVFVEPPSGWTNMTQTTKLVAADGRPGDFMDFVTIEGNLILASANHYDDPATPGAGYIFSGSGSNWTQIAELTSSDWAPGDIFASRAAFNGKTAVLSGSTEGAVGVGTAYVYVEASSGWTNMTETAELSPLIGTGSGFAAGAVSADGSAILATAPEYDSGTAFVFLEPNTGWATTSTPNLVDSGVEFSEAMQLGPSDLGAISATVNGSGAVLLFGSSQR